MHEPKMRYIECEVHGVAVRERSEAVIVEIATKAHEDVPVQERLEYLRAYPATRRCLHECLRSRVHAGITVSLDLINDESPWFPVLSRVQLNICGLRGVAIRAGTHRDRPGTSEKTCFDRSVGLRIRCFPLERFVARREVGETIEVVGTEQIAGLRGESIAYIRELASPTILVRVSPIVFADDRSGRRRAVDIRRLTIRRGSRIENLSEEQMSAPTEQIIVRDPQRIKRAGLIALRDPLLRVIGDIRREVPYRVNGEVPERITRRTASRSGTRVIVDALTNPEGQRVSEQAFVQRGISGSLHVASIGIEQRDHRMAEAAFRIVCNGKRRHGLRGLRRFPHARDEPRYHRS